MPKITWKPGTMLAPLPPALITSGTIDNKNIMTAAWTGIICSDPALAYVSIRPSRYTHELVSKTKEFVINLPTWREADATDTVGVKTGRNLDKFALTGLTAEPCSIVKAPQIKECPVSIECKVIEIRPFGTHDMFLAEIVAVNVDDRYINESGALDLEKAGLIAYAHGFYYTLGRKIGKFGFSVERKKKPKLQPATILKAKEKFGKQKTEEKFQASTLAKTTENGVEAITKKPRFNKTAANIKKREATPKKVDTGSKTFPRRPSKKFGAKIKKQTDFTQNTYQKRPNGSFKKAK